MSQKIVVACHLPGCGNVSQMIKDSYPEDNFVEIDFSNKSLTVDELTSQIQTALDENKSILYNNYNLKLTTRDSILTFIKDFSIQKICYFVVKPFEQCLVDREESIKEKTMYQMYFTMRIPWFYEGWDDINIVRIGTYGSSVRDLFRNKKYGLINYKINIGNKKTNLCNNLFNAHKYAIEKEYPEIVQKASLFYKVGLPFVDEYYKTSSDSDIFDHVNIQICCVSAYISLFYTDYIHHGILLRYKNANNDIDQLATAVLINWIAEMSDFSNEDTRFLYVEYFYDRKNERYKPLYKNMIQLHDVVENFK